MFERSKPKRLRPGMRIGVVAPSSPVLERSRIDRGVARLERLGFQVVLGEHALDSYGYLAGQDSDRAADLLQMLEMEHVDAVMCLSGGYGAIRTVAALDLPRLRRLCGRAPIPFIGYSDITVLHAVLRRELGWTTFYGPMLSSFARPTEYTLAAFQRALMETEPFEILPDPEDPYTRTVVPGEAEGELVGGCLSLLVSLMGTPWEMETEGRILFFEDVHEEPYRVDRMLSQLLAAGVLQKCAGIVIGEHVACAPTTGNSLGLEQVFEDLIRPLGIPTLYHLPVGHGRGLATLPLGIRARLDATNRQLRTVGPGVL
ncbi:MAG: LD-carboxypeptidase [Chloroflexota bacterium]|nr:LD-carboxypeptidase [Chloroflexota bacterium]